MPTTNGGYITAEEVEHFRCSKAVHLCYKTDFLFAKSQGSQSYFRYTILNTQWTFCASMGKIKVCYLFICIFKKYMFCVQVLRKWASWGRYLYFEAFKGLELRNAPYFFLLIFAENVTLLSRNIIKLILLGASTSNYKKSAINMWLYKGGMYYTIDHFRIVSIRPGWAHSQSPSIDRHVNELWLSQFS